MATEFALISNLPKEVGITEQANATSSKLPSCISVESTFIDSQEESIRGLHSYQ
jgi:hypothetical protein